MTTTTRQILEKDAAHSLMFDEMERALDGQAGLQLYNDVASPDADLYQELHSWPWRAIVFLFRETRNFGHYMLIWENSRGQLCIFDSYGRKPDEYFRFQKPDRLRHQLGQDHPFLLEAIDRACAEHYPDGVQWNQFDFQRTSPKITTCGRWCLVRLYLRDLSVDEFRAWVERACQKTGLSPDLMVTWVTQSV